MTSSDARLRFIVIAVNIETEARGAGRCETALNGFHKPRRGHCRPTAAWPLFHAGICRRLWLARKLALSSLTFHVRMHAADQVCFVRGKASNKSFRSNLITSWTTAVVSDKFLEEIFPPSALTLPVNHWRTEKRWWNVRFANTTKLLGPCFYTFFDVTQCFTFQFYKLQ